MDDYKWMWWDRAGCAGRRRRGGSCWKEWNGRTGGMVGQGREGKRRGRVGVTARKMMMDRHRREKGIKGE